LFDSFPEDYPAIDSAFPVGEASEPLFRVDFGESVCIQPHLIDSLRFQSEPILLPYLDGLTLSGVEEVERKVGDARNRIDEWQSRVEHLSDDLTNLSAEGKELKAQVVSLHDAIGNLQRSLFDIEQFAKGKLNQNPKF
jgi:hypothetical protein